MLSPTVIQSDHTHDNRFMPERWLNLTDNFNGYHVCKGTCQAQREYRYMINIIHNGIQHLVCGYHSSCRHTLEDCSCHRGLYHQVSNTPTLQHFRSMVATHSAYYFNWPLLI